MLSSMDLSLGCSAGSRRPVVVAGHPDQALQRTCEALTMAQELVHPQSLVSPCILLPMHHCREWHLLKERAEAEAASRPSRGCHSGWRGA